jgi:hypothetical protein
MEEKQKSETKNTSSIEDLLEEGEFSKKKKKGIIVLGLITIAWFASWIILKTPLFGWIPALIILFIVKTVFQDKPKKISSGRLRGK